MEKISLRQLNRMTLARQMLLERASIAITDAIERLVGLQAQAPRPPYIGLWTRLAGFDRQELARLIENRAIVRATLMRGTLHLMTTRDFLQFRPLLQDSFTKSVRMRLRGPSKILDIKKVAEVGRKILGQGPKTFGEIRSELLKDFPKHDIPSLSIAVRMILPLVQVPGKGGWGFPNDPAFTLAEDWLGQRPSPVIQMKMLISRYLNAFGPASIPDMQTWSGLSGLKAVVEKMRPELITYRDESGRELFDVPDLPIAAKDISAPVRFLPEYDNLLLSHAVRSRVLPEPYRQKIFVAPVVRASLLVDGFVQGRWHTIVKGKMATLVIEPFIEFNRKQRQTVLEEGEGLIRFIHGDAGKFELKLTDRL